MTARILGFPVRADGSLGEGEVVGPDGLGRGGVVDGCSFDADGDLWVATVVGNGLGVLTGDGDWHVVVEDPREEVLAAFAGQDLRPCRWARWRCRGWRPSVPRSRACR